MDELMICVPFFFSTAFSVAFLHLLSFRCSIWLPALSCLHVRLQLPLALCLS